MPSAPHGDNSSSPRSAYYWASGNKVRLTRSEQVALDIPRAERSQLAATELAAIRRRGRSISESLLILDEKQIDTDERAQLEAASALQPVYRSADGTLIIVLPEVRVEIEDPKRRRSLIDRYSGGDLGLELEEAKPGRFVITLGTGTGTDALHLSNELVETFHPDLAQARFVRLTSRPGVDTPSAG
jgi:hypothetical protein